MPPPTTKAMHTALHFLCVKKKVERGLVLFLPCARRVPPPPHERSMERGVDRKYIKPVQRHVIPENGGRREGR
jgi:hypothetical protein